MSDWRLQVYLIYERTQGSSSTSLSAKYRPFHRAIALRVFKDTVDKVDFVDGLDRIQFIRQANRATSTVSRLRGYGRSMPPYEYVTVLHENSVGTQSGGQGQAPPLHSPLSTRQFVTQNVEHRLAAWLPRTTRQYGTSTHSRPSTPST